MNRVVFLLVLFVATSVVADSPYLTDSYCAYNPGSLKDEPHHSPCSNYHTQVLCQSKAYCWWRDTTSQNALAEHTAEQTTGTVLHPYTADGVDVYVYSAYDIANPIVIVTSSHYFLIGCGGGNKPAAIAKAAFAAAIPNFASKTLYGILMTHSHTDHIWGCPVWTNNTNAIRFAHSSWVTMASIQQNVQTSLFAKVIKMWGQDLAWGPDKFLGAGLSYQFTSRPTQLWQLPTAVISANKNITIDGITITFMPALGETDDQVIAYLPVHKVLFPADNWYLSVVNGYTIRGTIARPITRWSSTIDTMRSLAAEVMVPEHMLPVYGAANILSALTYQRDTLTYIHDQTVALINKGAHLDDIVANVTLPTSLSSSAWVQQFYGYVPFITRAVYDYYMGWFNGDIATLESFSNAEYARRLVSIAGFSGTKKAAVKAITEHTRGGALWALKLANALHITYPEDYDVTRIYIQALKMLGWTSTSAPARNWYLTVAQTTEATLPVSLSEEDRRRDTEEVNEFVAREVEPMWLIMPTLGQYLHTDSTVRKAVKVVFTDYAGSEFGTWFITTRGPVAEVVTEEVITTSYDIVVSCNSEDFRAAWLRRDVSQQAFSFLKGTYSQLADFLSLFY